MSPSFSAGNSVAIWKSNGTRDRVFYYRANSDVNTDGSGRSYHPDDIAANRGLAQNILCNGVNQKVGAGSRSCVGKASCRSCLDRFRSVPKATMIDRFADYFSSYAIATRPGSRAACIVPDGRENAGYFVSTTSYTNPSVRNPCDPKRYFDAMVLPGIAVPASLIRRGVAMGDFVLVRNRLNGKTAFGVVNDSSGRTIGESSIAMNRLLLCARRQPGCTPPPMPTSLRQSYALVVPDADYLVFAGTAGNWPSSPAFIQERGARIFERWGGMGRLQRCASAYRR